MTTNQMTTNQMTVEQLQSMLGGNVSAECCQYLLGMEDFDHDHPVQSAVNTILNGKDGPFAADLSNIAWSCPGPISVNDRIAIGAKSRFSVLHLIGYYGSKFHLRTNELQMRLAIQCDESARGAIVTYSEVLTPLCRFILTAGITEEYTIQMVLKKHGHLFTGAQKEHLRKLLNKSD